jgi:AraC-like DNA-binding protein
MEAIQFTTYAPPTSISRVVRELWLLEDDGRFLAGLPKPYVELVISLAGLHWWRATEDGPEHQYRVGWVTPIQEAPRFARSDGRRILLGARLDPWAARQLFGPLPPGDGLPPPQLNTIIGHEARELRGQLVLCRDDLCRFEVLASWLQKRVAAAGSTLLPVSNYGLSATASCLSDALNISTRTLRRQFARTAGISPKRWLQLRRLDAALRDLSSEKSELPLAELAQDHGYVDQSHLCREIARFTGASPRALKKRPKGLPPHLLPK